MRTSLFKYIFYIVSLSFSELSAQVLCSSNCYRAGDITQVFLTTVTAPGEAGRNAVWDFYNQELSSESLEVKYTSISTDDKQLTRTFGEAMSYYYIDNDTLNYCGFENNQTKLHWDLCEKSLVFPMSYGNQIGGFLYGRGSYCSRYPFRAYGKYCTGIDGMGTLITPEGQVLHNVLRLHTQRVLSLNFFQTSNINLPIQNATVEYIDDVIQKDMSTITIDEYKWYAYKYRYPIIEYTEKYETASPDRKVSFAIYSRPNSLFMYLNDDDDKDVKSANSFNHEKENLSDSQYRDFNYNFSTNSNSKTLNLCIESKHSVEIEVIVATISGMVYWTDKKICNTSVDVHFCYSSCPRGQYVVYIKVGKEVVTEKFENN